VQKGQLKFNIDTGMIDSLTMNTDGTMEFTAPGPEGKTAKVVSKQKSKAEIVMAKGAPAPAAK
jgi:hypothetical protein